MIANMTNEITTTNKEWIMVSTPYSESISLRSGLVTSWRPCYNWCKQQFGREEFEFSDGVWRYWGEGDFEFMNEQDAVLFSLRWS